MVVSGGLWLCVDRPAFVSVESACPESLESLCDPWCTVIFFTEGMKFSHVYVFAAAKTWLRNPGGRKSDAQIMGVSGFYTEA